jgi:dethiobiotin synthetase
MNAIIITGTDTDVGKTIFAAALVSALGASYWKPIQCGLAPPTDRELVIQLGGLPPERALPEAYALAAACSPHFAAEQEGVTIDAERLRLPESEGTLVVEGAGGALVPVTRSLVFADVFASWGAPVVIVARTALGTINHSLLTIEALRARGVPILGLAFIGDANEDSERTIAEIGDVRRLGRLPMLELVEPEPLARAFAVNFRIEDFA